MEYMAQKMDEQITGAISQNEQLCEDNQKLRETIAHLESAVAEVTRERDEARDKLAYVHSMGLRFGMMKTSDKPEPYLAHTWTDDSDFERMGKEWVESIGWKKERETLLSKLAYAEDAATKGELARQVAGGMEMEIKELWATLEQERGEEIERQRGRDEYIQDLRSRLGLVRGLSLLESATAIRQERDSLRRELSSAKELLRGIRDGEVNAEDEADKFLRDHQPSELSKVRAELEQEKAKRAALEQGAFHLHDTELVRTLRGRIAAAERELATMREGGR